MESMSLLVLVPFQPRLPFWLVREEWITEGAGSLCMCQDREAHQGQQWVTSGSHSKEKRSTGPRLKDLKPRCPLREDPPSSSNIQTRMRLHPGLQPCSLLPWTQRRRDRPRTGAGQSLSPRKIPGGPTQGANSHQDLDSGR